MPAMSTPLKALIQERLRAKIVRQSDEDYDYEAEMYPPSAGRVQAPPPAAMHGSYTLAECKERSLPMSSSSASSGVASSVSSSAGFPLCLHTEINPAAYIPHGQPLSARDYISHHPGALSPSPSYGRHGHRQHQSNYHRHEDDTSIYHDSRHAYSSRSHHDIPATLELLASPRWDEPPRDLLRITSSSPPLPQARGHFHRQSSGDMHSRRWHEKSSVVAHHRSDRRRYDDDVDSDNNGSSRGGHSPMREFHHERKRERRQEYAPESHLTSEQHRMRDGNNNGNNQMWHNVPMSASKLSLKSHMDDRDDSTHSVRPAERTSYASSLAPSAHYTASKHHSNHHLHRHQHHRTQQLEEEEAPEESMASLMFLPPSDVRERSAEPQHFSKDLRSAPAPLDLSVVSSSRQKTRTFDQILSPGSRLAANAFVEKRQRRSGKSTPRTMATQSWLRSLDLREEP